MTNPAPILTLSGRCHSVIDRKVDPQPERPEQRDPETGRVTVTYLPAREGYDVVDVTVLTDEGGFVTASILPDELKALGGEIPTTGDDVTLAVRTYVRWDRSGARSFPRVGLSVAGDVTAKRRAADSAGRRVSPVSSAS